MDLKPVYRPKRGVFESTLACNLNCKHCGSSAGKARSDELTTAECQSLFIQLKELGLEWLTISGGEPMTRPDWAELIRLAKEAGLRVGMITNAIALDDDAAALAKKSGINSIGLSIDGLEATHDRIRGKKGHFHILEGAMEKLHRNDIPFSAITTLCNDNLAQLEELHSYISNSGAYSWQVQLGSDMGNLSHYPEMLISPRQLPKLEKRLANLMVSGNLKMYCADSLGYFGPHERIIRSSNNGHCFGGCGAGKRNIGIECNGNIKGCLSIMAGYNKAGHDYVEGNIRETSLADIWNRPGAFAYSRDWSRNDLTGFCKTCDYADKCKGGCLGKRVTDGNLNENPMCVYRVLVENAEEPKKVAQAAAVFFAFALGTSTAACDNAEEPTPTDTETTTDDTETNTNDVDLYGIQPDSNTDTETGYNDTAIYGFPDTETATIDGTDTYDVDLYGIQPDSETAADSDTMNIDWYGMPDSEMIALYDMPSPKDTDE